MSFGLLNNEQQLLRLPTCKDHRWMLFIFVTLCCFSSNTAASSNVTKPTTAPSPPPEYRLGILFLDRGTSCKRKVYNAITREATKSHRTEDYTVSVTISCFTEINLQDLLTEMCSVFLSRNITTLLFIAEEPDKFRMYQYILELYSSFGIPVISWNVMLPSTMGYSHLLQLSPSVRQQVKAILRIAKHYNWHKYNMLYTNVQGYEQLLTATESLISGNSEAGPTLQVSHTEELVLNDPMRLAVTLQTIKESESRVNILYAQSKDLERIFNKAEEFGVLGKGYVWIVTMIGVQEEYVPDLPPGILGLKRRTFHGCLLDSSRLGKEVYVGVKLWMESIDRMHRDRSHPQSELTPQFSCQSSDLNQWNMGGLLHKLQKEVSLEGEKVPPIRGLACPQLSMPPVKFDTDGANEEAVIEVMNVNSHKGWENVGTWYSEIDKLEIKDITWPGGLTSPPDGVPEKIHYKIVTIEEAPYVNYEDVDPVSEKCIENSVLVRKTNFTKESHPELLTNKKYFVCASGFAIDLLLRLRNDLNFDFEMYHVRDNKWGAPDPQNSKQWNGIPRDLMDGVADFSMTSLKIVSDRSRVVDFSVPFLTTGITIIVSIRKGVIAPTAFLEPYDPLSWILILVTMVNLGGFFIFLLEIIKFYFYKKDGWGKANQFSLFKSLWLIWTILFGAAVDAESPKGVASRFMVAVWSLFSLVFLASYTANLAAFMITKEDFYDLDGLNDWRLQQPYSHKPHFRFATVDNGSTAITLRKIDKEMFNYMGSYMEENVTQGIQSIKDNTIHAFIYDATVLDYLASHDTECQLRTVGEWFAMTGYGIAFPKGSKRKIEFDKLIMKYEREGFLEKMKNFWLGGACTQDSNIQETNELEVANFTSAFILLAAGVVAALVLMAAEYLYFSTCRRRLKNVDTCGCCSLISINMGQSLSFEESVMEVIHAATTASQCKSELCNARQWHLTHQLDIALLCIQRLRQRLKIKERWPINTDPFSSHVIRRQPSENQSITSGSEGPPSHNYTNTAEPTLSELESRPNHTNAPEPKVSGSEGPPNYSYTNSMGAVETTDTGHPGCPNSGGPETGHAKSRSPDTSYTNSAGLDSSCADSSRYTDPESGCTNSSRPDTSNTNYSESDYGRRKDTPDRPMKQRPVKKKPIKSTRFQLAEGEILDKLETSL